MIYISIAIVIVAIIAGLLINKYLDIKYPINIASADNSAEQFVALEETNKRNDQRINKAFETIQTLKSELESLRLQVAIKRSS